MSKWRIKDPICPGKDPSGERNFDQVEPVSQCNNQNLLPHTPPLQVERKENREYSENLKS